MIPRRAVAGTAGRLQLKTAALLAVLCLLPMLLILAVPDRQLPGGRGPWPRNGAVLCVCGHAPCTQYLPHNPTGTQQSPFFRPCDTASPNSGDKLLWW